MAIINLKVINDKQNLYKRGNGKYIFFLLCKCANMLQTNYFGNKLRFMREFVRFPAFGISF